MGDPWGVLGSPGGSPEGPWRDPRVFQRRFEISEKPVVFVVFPAIGRARGDIDSKRELLDVARRSLMGVPGYPWRSLETPGGSRGGSLRSRGAPLAPQSPLGRPP